jgi:hypothetical protein
MVYDGSISIQGIVNAGRDLDRAARRIAAGSSPSPADPTPIQADTVKLSKGGPSFSSEIQGVDYAAELAAVGRAKIAAQANLKVLSSTLDLEKEVIDQLP